MPLLRLIALIGYSLAGVLLFVVLMAAGTASWVLYRSQPELAGSDRLAGLAGDVTVIRGAHAIPHIFAGSFEDGYRALGYLHAQDRFFQMDFARRIAAGRMAEFAGASALRSDRFMRTLGLYRTAEAIAANAAPETRQALAAYTQGVNAWLASPNFRKPPELVLGAAEAEPWRQSDSIAIGRLMAVLLSGNWREELLRADLASRLTAEQLTDLWPPEAADTPATLPDLAALYPRLAPAAIAAAIPDLYPAASASNAWVVDGAHATTGKPLLANDPHLGFSAPGWWYLARIVTPQGERTGATLAGQPFAMAGHNGRVAWGQTTTHADTQDLFIEKLDPADPARYLTPDGPRAFTTRTESIAVRFRNEPELLTVRESRHGPIISDIVPDIGAVAGDGHVLALAWPGLLPDDRTADALARLNAAPDAAALMAALEAFDSPVQNFAFADTAGAIGFYVAGRIPVRKAGDGTAPVSGWTGEQDWTGFIPTAELPRALAPAKGRIVNANNRVVADGYPYRIAADWPEAYRAARIGTLLDSRPRHSPDEFAAMQTDTRSGEVQSLLPLAIALARGNTSDPTAPALLERLATWNGDMTRDSAEPLFYMAWMREIGRQIYRDELGDAFGHFDDFRPRILVRMLGERQGWCDDIDTGPTESCATIAGRSLDAALALLRDRLGDDVADWRWGDLHQAAFRHPVVGRVPLLRDLFGTVIATDGGPFTINRGTARLGDGDHLFAHIHGAGLRAVFDLAALDQSRYMIASGQSGHPLSPFYTDTTPIWRDGGTLTLSGDRQTLQREAVAILRLEP